jgi:hypothetical protein
MKKIIQMVADGGKDLGVHVYPLSVYGIKKGGRCFHSHINLMSRSWQKFYIFVILMQGL